MADMVREGWRGRIGFRKRELFLLSDGDLDV
jgi:hypothetical protein